MAEIIAAELESQLLRYKLLIREQPRRVLDDGPPSCLKHGWSPPRGPRVAAARFLCPECMAETPETPAPRPAAPREVWVELSPEEAERADGELRRQLEE